MQMELVSGSVSEKIIVIWKIVFEHHLRGQSGGYTVTSKPRSEELESKENEQVGGGVHIT